MSVVILPDTWGVGQKRELVPEAPAAAGPAHSHCPAPRPGREPGQDCPSLLTEAEQLGKSPSPRLARPTQVLELGGSLTPAISFRALAASACSLVELEKARVVPA